MAEKISEVTEQEWLEVNDFNRSITEEFLEQQHLSPHTLKQYRSSLRIFFRWVKDNCGNKAITDLKPRDALRYQNFLIGRELSSSAVKFKRSSVSSLCGYIELYYGEDYPLFRNIYNKKIPNPAKSLKHEKKPLSVEEYELLVKTLEEREEWQKLAYVWFTYITGCRRGESAQLLKEVANYDKAPNKNYYVTHSIRAKGKGREGKVRKFQFDDNAMNAIRNWIHYRGEDDCPYLFVKKTKDGKVSPLSPGSFNYWCSNDFAEIVGKRVHPHLFRSSRATNLVVHEKKNIEAAQALLGHNDPNTTKIYVVKDSEDDLDTIFE